MWSTKKQRGQSIVEVLVALSAALIIAVGVSTIAISSLRQATASKTSTQATQLAQEGIELAQMNDTLVVGRTYCVGSNSSFATASPCVEANIPPFKREIRVEADTSNPRVCGGVLKKVTVEVSWTDSTCRSPFCHKIPVRTCL